MRKSVEKKENEEWEESVLLGSQYSMPNSFLPTHSKDTRIYYHYYTERTFAFSISEFWTRDVAFSLKTKKAIHMLKYLVYLQFIYIQYKMY